MCFGQIVVNVFNFDHLCQIQTNFDHLQLQSKSKYKFDAPIMALISKMEKLNKMPGWGSFAYY